MLRWLTSGESHGPARVGILEGLPAGVGVTTADIQAALARRRLGYGRGARMTFETDEVRILAGVRHGLTRSGPVARQDACLVGREGHPGAAAVAEQTPGEGGLDVG